MTTCSKKPTRWILPSILLWFTGCSALGLSTTPVAHVMTNDTRTVLEQTSRMPNVPRELSKSVAAAHYLQPGDEVIVESVDFNSEVVLPADQQVMTDGSVDLGKYGRMVIASMTLEQAESSIQQAVAAMEKEAVTINVRLVQPVHRYYVVGEVNSPGAYPLVGHETVLDAIMEAGGLTARASACDLLLARPTAPCSCRVSLPVCYRAITQLGDTTTNYHLQPGDRIFVGRQSLCEEIKAFYGAGMTCERCCKSQQACGDPNVAVASAPAFVPPPVLGIPAPVPPSGNVTASPSPDSTAPEISTPKEPAISTPAPLPKSQPEQSAFPAGLDGELDFEGFLQQTE